MFRNLLKSKTFDGYPGDFVLARIRGRGYCAPEGSTGRVSSRQDLDREYGWIFGLLDKKATKIFHPFFCLFEIERVVACLRLERGRESTLISSLLADSLISEPVRSLLEAPYGQEEKVRRLVELIETSSATRKRIQKLLAEESWRDLEACFLECCLQWAARSSRRQEMKRFFQARIDMRNLLAVHKALRWKSKETPSLLDGGRLGQRSIRKRLDAGSLDELENFARRRLWARSTGNLEYDLIHGLAVQLHRQGRSEGGWSVVLSHLWGLYAGLREKTAGKRGYGEVA